MIREVHLSLSQDTFRKKKECFYLSYSSKNIKKKILLVFWFSIKTYSGYCFFQFVQISTNHLLILTIYSFTRTEQLFFVMKKDQSNIYTSRPLKPEDCCIFLLLTIFCFSELLYCQCSFPRLLSSAVCVMVFQACKRWSVI